MGSFKMLATETVQGGNPYNERSVFGRIGTVSSIGAQTEKPGRQCTLKALGQAGGIYIYIWRESTVDERLADLRDLDEMCRVSL